MKCPFRSGNNHSSACVCHGTGRVISCTDCAGSGWNGAKNRGLRRVPGQRGSDRAEVVGQKGGGSDAGMAVSD